MMNKLGYLAAGLIVAAMMTLSPASALAGCGACGAEAKAECAEDCSKECCAKKECGAKKKACCATDCQKACCAKDESGGDGA